MRDTQVTRGRDGCFFMTGSVAAEGQPDGSLWKWNDGIRVWKSRDLKEWEPLGLVWSLDECDGWPRDFYIYPPDESGYILTPDEFYQSELPEGTEVRRSSWAPEIHYLPLQDNYFLAGCVNHNMLLPSGHEPIGHGLKGATFVLRSTTREPEGPYELISPNAPLTAQIDTNLFEDDDGKIYLVYQDGKIARLKDDLTGLAEEPQLLSQQLYPEEPYKEGVFLFKHNGKYILSNTIWSTPDPDHPGTFHYASPKDGVYSYDAVIASSDSIYGPYGVRTTSLIGGGHGNFFEDFEGQWWACIFWNPRGEFAETLDTACCPAFVPMMWEGDQMFPDFNTAEEFYNVGIPGDVGDREIGENGSIGNLQYFGVGDYQDVDLCGAVLFELPVLAEGEVVTNANLSFYVRTVGELSHNADLYGIGFSTEAVISNSNYYEGDFLTDENGHAGLQDDVLTPSVTAGVHTSDDISTWVQSYYTANPDYSGGTYAVFRFNADIEDSPTNVRYEIGQANNATAEWQPHMILMTEITVSGVTVDGHPADRQIGEDGSLGNAQYFGVGDYLGVDLCGVILFELPVLSEGEAVLNATLSFYVRTVGALDFNADLYGVEFTTDTLMYSSNYYEGAFLSDENGHVGLQDDVLTPSVTAGIYTSDDVSTWVQSYYTANPDYSGGTYAVFRFNADIEDCPTGVRYEIGQANNATTERQPDLILTTGVPSFGYEAWASGWGIDIGAVTNDYDGDGLLNVCEYGLGGNPTNAADQGISPVFVPDGSGTNLTYIYPQLSDPDSGLNYYLELTDDLVSGSWSNAGYTVLGTGTPGGDFETVTNRVPADVDQRFVRLMIEQL